MTLLLERNFPATAAALAEMRQAVKHACHAAGCSEDGAEQWVLAINEACMNIIEHGYHRADNCIYRIELSAEADQLTALICDNGTPVQLPDLQPREFADLRPGGLGVRFMRELTDTMHYLPANADWHNRLQLRTRIR